MSYLTEVREQKPRRRNVVVGHICDVCGRRVRGRAPSWWRLAVWPSRGPRRERLRRHRVLHVCSSRCLLHKLKSMRKPTRVGLRFGGAARSALRGLTYGPPRTPPRMTSRARKERAR